jgi:2,4-dienoyl-CoA reductase-like NADH-dependent reductase (Old Yellow Enzyme family)
MGSLTRNRADGNVPSDLQVEHYRQRARGGAGLIITEGLLIVQQGYTQGHIWVLTSLTDRESQHELSQYARNLVPRARRCVEKSN